MSCCCMVLLILIGMDMQVLGRALLVIVKLSSLFFFYLGLDSASIFVCVSILWYLCPFRILGSTSGIVANFSIPKSKKCSRITEGISSHLSI